MKKLFKALFLSTFILISFCSCHGSRGLDKFVIPEAFDTSQRYEISFWAKNDTNKAQTDIYEKAISDFEALYPNIKINLKLYTDYNRIYNDVITNIATRTTPNVCITYPDHIATYMTGQNIVVPLTELFDDSKYGLGGNELRFDSPSKEEIIPRFLSECILNNDYYAIPFMRSTEACYINKTFVEKLGFTLPETLTWDFIWEVSESAMKKDSDGNFIINGTKVMIPFIYKSTDNMMIQWLYQNGAPYSTTDGDILIFNDKTREILEKVDIYARSRAFSTFKISSYPANLLNAGQCIFAIDSTAGATWMGTNAPLSDISEEALVEFETEVMEIPQINPENPKMISQGPSICIFNKSDNSEVLASWLFAQFLLTNNIQNSYSATEGYVPVTSKAQNSPEYKEYLSKSGSDNNYYYDVKIKASQLLLNNLENTFITPVFNGSASLRNAAGQMIENVAKSARRGQTIDDEYYNTLYSDVNSLYRLSEFETTSSSIEKNEFSPLPTEATVLLWGLGIVWGIIIVYLLLGYINKRNNKK